ncbi:MAG TPA: acetate kinase [Acholeplasmataceae bacterium]|nr:acetate kinase [Acholeplasmataceae bacterium]
MKKIISINAGSSSLKFQLLTMPEEKVIASGLIERIGLKDSAFTIKFNGEKKVKEQPIKDHAIAADLLLDALLELGIIKSADEIDGVGHRVVQGGETFKDSAVIDDKVVEEIEDLIPLAPLHNPANVTGIKAFRKAMPNVLHIAVFDTTFHQTMEPDAFLYATPYEWYEKYGVRKYGFHGTSHQYVSQKANELLENDQAKVIVCHIGNGVSISAVDAGKSVDTSMGLTPLEGVPMGTRSGNIDPAVLSLVQAKEGRTLTYMLNELNKNSGYLGVSGVSNDSRDLLAKIDEGHERSLLAIKLQAKRIADYIGSYYIRLKGLDAIAFTAGIGENAAFVRDMIVDYIEVLGVKLDQELNDSNHRGIISTKDSKVKVLVIPTDEEVMIAREVFERL